MIIKLNTPFKVPKTDAALEETINALSWGVVVQNGPGGLAYIQFVPGYLDPVTGAFTPSAVLTTYMVDFNPATLQMSVNSAPKITLSATQAAAFQAAFDGPVRLFAQWFLSFYALSEWAGVIA